MSRKTYLYTQSARKTALIGLALLGFLLFSFSLVLNSYANGAESMQNTRSAQSRSADAVTARSWSEVASSLAKNLDAGVSALDSQDSHDVATAAASFQRAYNVDYIASNMAVVIKQYISEDSAQQIQNELLSLTTDVYSQSKKSTISSRVKTLKETLTGFAAQLDATQGLKNPRDYAAERIAQTQAERKKLDASKTRKNTGRGSRSWSEIADEMTGILDKAQKAATSEGNDSQGSDLVNNAYYQYYEKLGFEKTVMSAISGARVSEVENQFKETRKSMINGKPDAIVVKNVATLKKMLVADAKILDNGAVSHVNPFISFVTSTFGQAFIILLREGVEAILVVAAIISYLAKTRATKMLKFVYVGAGLGLVASGIMAVLLMFVYTAAQGAGQELFEGVTALIAMIMLLFTSNWMLCKTGNKAWVGFINDKAQQSISRGSVFSLALLAFLAVFREGAETVIFYQALASMVTGTDFSPLWWGAGAAVVALIVIFLLFRLTTMKIPYKEFFAVMSIIMAVMVVVFAGSGLHELIEADVINGTYISTWPTNDFLGIYPYVQTVVFQIVVAVIVIALLTITAIRTAARARRKRHLAEQPNRVSQTSQQNQP
ncbi:FTR1 family protein [Alloscardovia venturai]|uniref:FTR1 family protein n=1 Tax=Alloscardovia venturai TaxID=1769421 RepID=A0ABW2Y358_9BIFI